MSLLTLSGDGFSTGIPLPKPTKAERPGVIRRKEIKDAVPEWHDKVVEKGRTDLTTTEGKPLYLCFHCKALFTREYVCGDHWPRSKGARPDLKLDPDAGVCCCMTCNVSNSPTRKHENT